MQIRYNLKAFLVLIAIIAVSCFLLVKNYRYQRFKGIPEGMYKVTTTFDEKGVDIAILSNTELVKQVKIEFWNENTFDRALTSKLITFDSATEKTIRIEIGMVDQVVTESVGQNTRIMFPVILDGVKLSLANAKREGFDGCTAPDIGISIYQFKNDLHETIDMLFYVQ